MILRHNKKIFLIVSSFFLLFVIYFLLPVSSVMAADLYFSPAAGAYKIGDTFVADFFVNSEDQPMNAVASEIKFPYQNLEVVNLTKDGSIINFWLRQPSFSNLTGKINFEGVIFNPGFKGEGGKILSIKFKIKAGGSARLSLSSSYVLANDGKGTNILENLGETNYIFSNDQPAAVSSSPSNVAGAPLAPQINSSTHTDPNRWYAYKNPRFNWSTPSEVTGVRFTYDKNPNNNLEKATFYTQIITLKEYKGLADGSWYFHLQFRNKYGVGAIAHFRFNIDSEPPNPFTIELLNTTKEECPVYPKVSFKFKTVDALSGIEYYEAKIDDANLQIINNEEMLKANSILTLAAQKPGDHLLSVRAVDHAGNYSFATKKFCITPLPAPVFTDYPSRVNIGENIVIGGTAITDAMVRIFMRREQDQIIEEVVKTDKKGTFSYVSSKDTQAGLYTFWAESVDMNGAISNISDKINLFVDESWLIKFGKTAIDYLSVMVVLFSIIAIFVFLIYYFFGKIRKLRKQITVEADEAETSTKESFNLLKEEVEKQVARIDGQPGFNEREREACDCLKKALAISEKMISKEIKDIQKEIKK